MNGEIQRPFYFLFHPSLGFTPLLFWIPFQMKKTKQNTKKTKNFPLPRLLDLKQTGRNLEEVRILPNISKYCSQHPLEWFSCILGKKKKKTYQEVF
jgi:hypothetical protein